MKAARCLFAVLLPALVFATTYRDRTHFSSVFQQERNFRVYTPPAYDSSGSTTYPVIYYCHGCLGSYKGDQYSTYIGDGHYTHPYNCSGPSCDPVMNKPFNPDFQMYVDSHAVIVVMVDGKLYNNVACDVWVPYEYNTDWPGNEFRFGLYIRELISVVDSLYKTKADPQYRAITGLSMGGQASLYLSMFNPHLFRSASSFCYSCSFHSLAAPPNTTPSDPQQFWRNYRGLSMRTHANTEDYLYQYSQQMGVLLQGAGFPNEYHLKDFWRHWACDIDSQFDFHMRTFQTPKTTPRCFSHIDPYPDFDVWDYTVASGKAEEGWIFLKDVTKSSLGIHTRYHLPYGKSLSNFGIKLTTAPLYEPAASYDLTTYDYRSGVLSSGTISADASGRLAIQDTVGLGREYGVSGHSLKPAVTLLADTINDCIFLQAGADSSLAFEVANLSSTALSNVQVIVKTDNPFLNVVSTHPIIPSLPAQSRIRLDSLVTLSGSYTRWENIGYIKVYFAVDGDTLDKEHIIQVHVMDSTPVYDSTLITLYDNGTVTNHADTGKIYSIYVSYPYDDVMNNNGMNAPVVPVNGQNNPDIVFEGYNLWTVNRAREVVEAKFRFSRVPTVANPIVLPFMTELAYTDWPSGSDRGVDVNVYRYGKAVFPYSAVGVQTAPRLGPLPLAVSAMPNPFYPVTRIRISRPLGITLQSMAIYSPDGRKVRAFRPESVSAKGFLTWDGRSDLNGPLPSGLYLFRMTAAGRTCQTKIVYLR